MGRLALAMLSITVPVLAGDPHDTGFSSVYLTEEFIEDISYSVLV